MSNIRFEWNRRNADVNLKKHGVSFDEAMTAFYDAQARYILDPEFAGSEDRFVLIGTSVRLRIIVVCHCCRKNDSVIRIISARKATARERKLYGEHL